MNVISLKNVGKVYRSGRITTPAIQGIDLVVRPGDFLAIMGPSGSGKSTLMNIIGLLDRPTEGELSLRDKPISLSLPDRRLARLRGQTIGFVFQSYNLLPRLTTLENVLLPSVYQQISRGAARRRATMLLERVGLAHRAHYHATELSGGEKQRAAIARALMNNPDIILADEPTGNLDSKTGRAILDLMQELNREGKTILMITHDATIAKLAKRIVYLQDGQLTTDKAHG